MVQHIFSELIYASHVPKEACILIEFHIAKANCHGVQCLE